MTRPATGTAAAPAPELTPATISEWANSAELTKKIAASLARKITAGEIPPYHELPPNEELADEWDASERTASRAKKLLSEHGLIRITGHTYYVTRNPPQPKGNVTVTTPDLIITAIGLSTGALFIFWPHGRR